MYYRGMQVTSYDNKYAVREFQVWGGFEARKLPGIEKVTLILPLWILWALSVLLGYLILRWAEHRQRKALPTIKEIP